MSPTALIAGVTGQDGRIWPTICWAWATGWWAAAAMPKMANTSRHERLGIATDVELVSLAQNDFRSVLKVVSGVQPQEIFNLAR